MNTDWDTQQPRLEAPYLIVHRHSMHAQLLGIMKKHQYWELEFAENPIQHVAIVKPVVALQATTT